MAEGGPPTLQLPPVHTPPVVSAMLPTPPVQLVQDAVQPTQVQVQPVQTPLNLSYFKPEFSDKPEEGAEAHLLKTNEWMETHNFPEVAKVQRLCLILTGEVRLWYESLQPIVVDWQGLQDQFRQLYSKFGNT